MFCTQPITVTPREFSEVEGPCTMYNSIRFDSTRLDGTRFGVQAALVASISLRVDAKTQELPNKGQENHTLHQGYTKTWRLGARLTKFCGWRQKKFQRN